MSTNYSVAFSSKLHLQILMVLNLHRATRGDNEQDSGLESDSSFRRMLAQLEVGDVEKAAHHAKEMVALASEGSPIPKVTHGESVQIVTNADSFNPITVTIGGVAPNCMVQIEATNMYFVRTVLDVVGLYSDNADQQQVWLNGEQMVLPIAVRKAAEKI